MRKTTLLLYCTKNRYQMSAAIFSKKHATAFLNATQYEGNCPPMILLVKFAKSLKMSGFLLAFANMASIMLVFEFSFA